MGRHFNWVSKKLKHPFKSKPYNHEVLSSLGLKPEDFGWIDRLLFNFSQQTPKDWLPDQYQGIFRQDHSKGKLH